jgi:sialidase-1
MLRLLGLIACSSLAAAPYTEVFRTTAAADDTTTPYSCAWAPALVQLNASLLLLFYEGRTDNCTDEGGRTDLLFKRSTNNGKTWSAAPTLLYSAQNDSRYPHKALSDNCPLLDRTTGRLLHMFDNNATFALLTSSTDMGDTFSAPVDVTAQVKKPSWGFWAPTLKGIQLEHHPEHAGRLVVSADFVPYQPGHNPSPYPIDKGQSYAILSDDGGATWRPGGANPLLTTNECAIAELHDGTLVRADRTESLCGLRLLMSTSRRSCRADGFSVSLCVVSVDLSCV